MRHILLTLACGAYAQRSEHIVHLSDEKHHSSLTKDYPDALAITHLPSVPALILDLAPAEAAALTEYGDGLELPCPIQGEDGYVPGDDDDDEYSGYWDDWSWWDDDCVDDTSAEDSYGDEWLRTP